MQIEETGILQVWVLLEINSLKRKLAETLTAVLVAGRLGGHTSTSHLGADTSFVRHVVWCLSGSWLEWEFAGGGTRDVQRGA